MRAGPRAQRGQDVAHAAVVDALRPDLAGAVRAEGEHDGVDTVHRGGERVGSGDVADDHLRLGRKPARLAGVAHQGPYGVALPDRLLDDEAADAAGRADDQHGHAGDSWRLPSEFALGRYGQKAERPGCGRTCCSWHRQGLPRHGSGAISSVDEPRR